MVNFRPTALTLALVCLSYGSARAEDEPADTDTANQAPGVVIIEGDRMQVQLDRKMQSIGNAALHRDGQDIYGDRIEYDVQNEELHVVGNARIESTDIKVRGPELRMKLSDSTGEMKSPSFTMENRVPSLIQLGRPKSSSALDPGAAASSEVMTGYSSSIANQNVEDTPEQPMSGKAATSRGDASIVFFEGEGKKRLKNARYTTCSADSDDWYIKASELELDDFTKSGTAKNARVEFKGVPILYSPWMDFSFSNQRKSGFLAPTWGTTTLSGFQVVTPYYWNIAPNMDATIAPRFMSKRGTQLVSEFRYLGERYSGLNNLEYLPSDSTTGQTRYYANLRHQQNFGGGLSGGYNIEKTSDDKYFSENLYYARLSTGIRSSSRILLPQNAFLNYSLGPWNLNALVSKFQTLDDISFPYERLPQLTLTGNQDYGPLTVNMIGQWVKFDRNANAPVAVTGSRFVANPSISTTFARPYGYITPKVGLHYTDYSLENASIADNGVANFEAKNRTLPIFSLDSGLFFDRSTRVVKTKYTQTLEPRLFYVYIPYQNQDRLPVFDTSEATLSLGTLFLENQFTGYDRVNNANQVTLALTTRMIDNSTGEQRLAASIGQRHYFSDQRVTLPTTKPRANNTSDIFVAVTARLKNKWNVDLASQYNTDDTKLVRSNVSARYNPEPGKTFNFGYRYTQTLLDQINISGQWPLGVGWYGLGRWNYSLRESRPIEGLAGLEYDAGCWQARGVLQRIATATAEPNYALFFQLELGGLASIGQNPLRLLQRGIPGYSPSGSIPDTYQQPYYE
ncbi:MAG TPA: LPS-assembly protein LptD [Methylophilaceae bacterium]|nr:LPS-assembly protein LptD [Methylophilaceae bacterium]